MIFETSIAYVDCTRIELRSERCDDVWEIGRYVEPFILRNMPPLRSPVICTFLYIYRALDIILSFGRDSEKPLE